MKQLSKIMLAAVASVALAAPRLPGISQQADPQRLPSIKRVLRQMVLQPQKRLQLVQVFQVLVQV